MDLNKQISDAMNSTKSCSDCQTTRTPLWRSGPSGPKSLCNACGIKYNKKRRALLGLDTGSKNKKRSGKCSMKQKNSEMGRRSLKLRLVTLGGGEMVLQPEQKRRGGELGEEEQAAILLMALSCGSFYV